jgi:hypothetical protein
MVWKGCYRRNHGARWSISGAIPWMRSCCVDGEVRTTMSASLRVREAAVKVRMGARYEHWNFRIAGRNLKGLSLDAIVDCRGISKLLAEK